MVKIAGSSSHIARLKKPLSPSGSDLLAATLFEAGNRVQTDAQTSITEGAISGKGHVPSIAPNPPNNDTGVLANNIETVQVEKLKVEVSSNAVYAAAQEFGNSRLPARPYMAPALQNNKERIGKRIAQAVNIINRKGG